jgi:hypothetical protein
MATGPGLRGASDVSELSDWARRGWVTARKTPVQRLGVLWADGEPSQLTEVSQIGISSYSKKLTVP